MADWQHKDVWTKRGTSFLVQVSRHGARPLDDSEGPNTWAVYAYIYPKHPHFANFDDSDNMWQDAANAMPLHAGPSYFQRHLGSKGETTSFQVGADYHHLHDCDFTHMATREAAESVFDDAQWLFDWLEAREKPAEPVASEQEAL